MKSTTVTGKVTINKSLYVVYIDELMRFRRQMRGLFLYVSSHNILRRRFIERIFDPLTQV